VLMHRWLLSVGPWLLGEQDAAGEQQGKGSGEDSAFHREAPFGSAGKGLAAG